MRNCFYLRTEPYLTQENLQTEEKEGKKKKKKEKKGEDEKIKEINEEH